MILWVAKREGKGGQCPEEEWGTGVQEGAGRPIDVPESQQTHSQVRTEGE